MRWVLAIGLIAGCGRIGFDPPGAAGGGVAGDDVAIDAASPGTDPPSAHYITGGSASQQGPTGQITTMTGTLDDRDMVVVVAVHWRDASASVSTVLDTFGNGFSTASGMTRYNAAQSQIIWFKRVTAGTDIRVLFDQPAVDVDLKWAAYRDIAQITTGQGRSGTSASADTGDVSLDGPAVLVASSASLSAGAVAGPGFAQRQVADGGVLEDREVAVAGAANATATLSASDEWIIQVVALRPL